MNSSWYSEWLMSNFKFKEASLWSSGAHVVNHAHLSADVTVNNSSLIHNCFWLIRYDRALPAFIEQDTENLVCRA